MTTLNDKDDLQIAKEQRNALEKIIKKDDDSLFDEKSLGRLLEEAGLDDNDIEGLSNSKRLDLYEKTLDEVRNDIKDLQADRNAEIDQALDELEKGLFDDNDGIKTSVNLRQDFENAASGKTIEKPALQNDVQLDVATPKVGL